MEEDMVEDTASEEVEYTFTAYEIDLDYEFDAARFFDFSRDESPLEARQAELWFGSAGSYPPSPFVSKLVPLEDMLMENVNISPKSKYRGEGQDMGTSSSVDVGSQNQPLKLPPGLAFYNHMVNTVNSENQTKLSKKPALPRTSTLMKPTTSQLAKQNRPFQAGRSRSCVSVLDQTSKTAIGTCVVENQAAKRQKLEGGLLRKVVATVQLQQTNFVHKASKRDELLGGNMIHAKARITIPRDPDLETAHRAQRTRGTNSKDENVASTVRRFKALPLNRKILEAPSLLPKRSTPRIPNFQEFHLKTSERALQHSSASSKSAVPLNRSNKDSHVLTTNLTTDCGSREPGRASLTSRPDGCQSSHSFKALPLNKKILSSKGDIGILRNFKKETTEFNFQTETRSQNNPPIEHFNKLSLACETQPDPKEPWSLSTSAKGSKENRWGRFHKGNEIKQPAKVKLPLFGGIQENIEVNFASWSKPIR
ncbi:hypothetical protein OROMI_020534 [Orobanche minor]